MKAEWILNNAYQELYDKSKAVTRKDTCMKFYNEMKPLYLKTDASTVGMGAMLLQVRDDVNSPKDETTDNMIS